MIPITKTSIWLIAKLPFLLSNFCCIQNIIPLLSDIVNTASAISQRRANSFHLVQPICVSGFSLDAFFVCLDIPAVKQTFFIFNFACDSSQIAIFFCLSFWAPEIKTRRIIRSANPLVVRIISCPIIFFCPLFKMPRLATPSPIRKKSLICLSRLFL